MANIWDKFDKTIDTEGFKKDVKEAAENGGSFEEVPEGTYEVEVDKLELKETKKCDPMLSCWMKISAGDHKGRLIFYNQVLTSGKDVYNANKFLRGLGTDIEIKFDNFVQYNELISNVFDKIKGSQYIQSVKNSKRIVQK